VRATEDAYESNDDYLNNDDYFALGYAHGLTPGVLSTRAATYAAAVEDTRKSGDVK
jgi:hypothetical protein